MKSKLNGTIGRKKRNLLHFYSIAGAGLAVWLLHFAQMIVRKCDAIHFLTIFPITFLVCC